MVVFKDFGKQSQPSKEVWGSGGEAPGKIFMTPLKNALVRGGWVLKFLKNVTVASRGGGWVPAKSERHVIYGGSLNGGKTSKMTILSQYS